MHIKSLSFKFYLFVIGAIINAVFSFKSEEFVTSLGTGIAAIFLFIAAFRSIRKKSGA